jgi:predicted lipoprotein with Yx(FWY)xxD motif
MSETKNEPGGDLVSRYRIRMLLLGLPVAALTASAVAVARGEAPAAHAAKAAKVQLRQTNLGKILVNSSGRTLYLFTHDSKNKDTCVKISGCKDIWPPLKTTGKPTAGSGVRSSLLSTITLAHGVKQVTYAGHPLYTYTGDSGPGQTDYVGTPQFGGTWDAIDAKGHAVR